MREPFFQPGDDAPWYPLSAASDRILEKLAAGDSRVKNYTEAENGVTPEYYAVATAAIAAKYLEERRRADESRRTSI